MLKRNTTYVVFLIYLQTWKSISWQGSLFASLKHRCRTNYKKKNNVLPQRLLGFEKRLHHILESSSNAKSNEIEHTERMEVEAVQVYERITQSNADHSKSDRVLSDEQIQELNRLMEENHRLREALDRVETENVRLQQNLDSRIILEVFEGESRMRRTNDVVNMGESMTLTAENMIGEEAYFNLERTDTEECLLDDPDSCPIEPHIPFGEALRDRAFWLVGLLAMQSCSGFILANNEALLGNHPIIVYFLTMLVGAGGNAGNQASVRVIRGLALGTLNKDTQRQFLVREFKMACALSVILSLTGFIRASVFRTPLPETIAVTTALALIVFSSICLGAVLPLFLKALGVDPAHSSTTIQVVMDILGVLLCVFVSGIVLDSPLGALLLSRLSFGAA